MSQGFSVARASAVAEPLGLRRAEAAKFCGLATATLDQMRREGRAPAPLRIGRAVMWSRDVLRDWMQAGCPDRETWEKRQQSQPGH